MNPKSVWYHAGWVWSKGLGWLVSLHSPQQAAFTILLFWTICNSPHRTVFNSCLAVEFFKIVVCFLITEHFLCIFLLLISKLTPLQTQKRFYINHSSKLLKSVLWSHHLGEHLMWAWEDLWFAIVKWTVLLIQIRACLLVYLWILDVPHWFLLVHLIYCLWCSVFKVTLIFLFFSRTGTFIIMQFSVLTFSISLTYFFFWLHFSRTQ